MNVVKPLGSAEIEKSSEVEAGGNIHELARGSSAVFRPGEASDVEMSSDNLAGLYAEYQKHRRAKLRTSLVTSRRYAKNCTPTAIAFNAILRNTPS